MKEDNKMYISIILDYKDGIAKKMPIIERIQKEGNAIYLARQGNKDFPYLSEVELDDYSIFGSQDMEEIIKELMLVRQEVTENDDREHIDDIIRLARRCRDNPDTVLAFVG